MFQGLIIAFREGVESFLIVALTALYLSRTGRHRLLKAVWLGTALSVVSCAIAGYFLSRAMSQSFWEGVLAFAAAALVGSLLIYMKRVSGHIRQDIEKKIDHAADRSAATAGFWGIFLFVVLMVTREGMETAMMIDAAMFELRSRAVLVGLVLGIATAVGLGFLWLKLGRRVNLKAVLNVSAVYLALFLLELLIYGFHEFAEAGIWPQAATLHAATEPFGPDGRYGHLLTYALVVIPTVWLLAVAAIQKLRGRNRGSGVFRSSET